MKLIGLPGNEVPEGLNAGELQASDGVRLRYALLDPPAGCRGTVCILPGRADFIERFFETIEDLRRRRFAVAIVDWRGQGGSQRPFKNPWRGHVSSFRRYDRDLASFMQDIVLPDCPPPYYALAHSTGAQVLLRTIHDHTWFDKVIMTSPFVGLSRSVLPRFVIRFIALAATVTGFGWVFVPGQRRRPLKLSDFPGNGLTSDVGRFSRDTRTLERAPHLGVGGPTLGWLNAAIHSIADLPSLTRREKLRIPAMFVTAGADKIVSVRDAYALAARIPGISVVKVDNARHELLNERDEFREQFWAAFDSLTGESSDQGLPGEENAPSITAART